jgi:hypothetical protein
MFFVHRVLNAVTMMYNEADELTACHFIRPSTYWKKRESEKECDLSTPEEEEKEIEQNEPN